MKNKVRNSSFAIHTLALDDEGHNNNDDDDGEDEGDVNVLVVKQGQDVSHVRNSTDECLPFNASDRRKDRESDEAGMASDDSVSSFVLLLVVVVTETRHSASSCGKQSVGVQDVTGLKRDIDFTDEGSARLTSSKHLPLDSGVIAMRGQFALLLLTDESLISSGEW